MTELQVRLKEHIEACEKEYESKKGDPFDSVVLQSRLQQLRAGLGRLTRGETAPTLLAEWRQMLPALKDEREQEAASPSFDWYDDHYQYKVLDGRCRACAELIRLIEASL